MLGWTLDQLEEIRLAGFSFLREGKYDKALIFFKALVILDSKNAYDMQTLGALYLQMGKGDLAFETLSKAIALDPASDATRLNLVKAQFMIGKKLEALSMARQLDKSPDLTIAGDASALISAYT